MRHAILSKVPGEAMADLLFGKRLLSQIVRPLVAVAVLAGLVATLVAVYSVSQITDRWVNQVAEFRLEDTRSGFQTHLHMMSQQTDLIASDQELIAALEANELSVAGQILAQVNRSLHYDDIEILDTSGRVIVSARLYYPGAPPVSWQDEPRQGEYIDVMPAFRKTGDGRLALTTSSLLATRHQLYELRIVHVVDDALLQEIAGSTGESTALYDRDMQLVAFVKDRGGHARDSEYLNAVSEIFTEPHPSVYSAIRGIVGQPGHATVEISGRIYTVTAASIHLRNESGQEPDTYLVTLVSQAVSKEARDATIALIGLWSLVALMVLTVLGFWVTGRVARPLEVLTEGAKQISEGDFSARIEVDGPSEIVELAGTFNDMTDSLRERSESLTKRVLEIATLYEMSKALGATLDMEVLLDSVLDSALRIFDADLGYITLMNHQTGQLEIHAWRGGDMERPGAEALRTSMSEWVIREGRPLIFNPLQVDAGDRRDSLTGALAALCVPFVSSEGTFGAITVGHSRLDARFTADDVRLMSTIANHANIAIGNIELFSSLEESYLATVRSLAIAVDAKDPYTRGHSDRVATYVLKIADRMKLSRDQKIAIEMAAYLHDIGKIGIRDDILLKLGALDDGEMAEMRHHPLIAANILKPVGFPWPIAPIVRHHHERWDGLGYPAGLRGEEIPLLARILTVADSFEAMISSRPYRVARTIEEAVAELRNCAGTHFDPAVVEAFVEALEEEDAELEVMLRIDGTSPEELKATFVVYIEGLLDSFIRLAGPRLSLKIEAQLNEAFAASDLPVKVANGRVSVSVDDSDEGIEQMRRAVRVIDGVMEQASGAALVEHYHADALKGLSTRMRLVVEQDGFLER